MGDIERAKAALLDAHAAGDTDSAQQLADYIRANEPERSWSNVAGSAIQNLIPSTGRVIGDIAKTVMHPIDTAKNIGKLGYGAIQNALPESVVNAIGADKESQDMASNVGQFYKDRYGSMKGFKEALATDPAGILMDAGSAFTGGGAAISKIPTLSKVGNVVSKAGSYVDPLANAARGVGAITRVVNPTVTALLGNTTGVGSEAIKEAYRSGKAGGSKAQMLADNLRGRVPIENVLDDAKQNLSAMNTAKLSDYKNNMEAIKTDKSILDFSDINNSLNESTNRTKFFDKTIDSASVEALQKAKDIIEDWQISSPEKYHTPEGMDKLKQKIYNEVLSKVDPIKEKSAYAVIGNIHKSIKETIGKQAPTYAEVMKDYHNAENQIQEVTRSLSLGNKASADTGMRKLQSVMRNNVNTNYGNRLDLIKALEGFGTKDVMPALAGQSLNSLVPRGLQSLGTTSAIGATAALGNPLALGMLALQSPRLVGEASLLAGKGAGLVDKGANLIRKTPILGKTDPRILANALYQMQQPKEQRQ